MVATTSQLLHHSGAAHDLGCVGSYLCCFYGFVLLENLRICRILVTLSLDLIKQIHFDVVKLFKCFQMVHMHSIILH